MKPGLSATGSLLTIGYGDRPWDAFADRLKQHNAQFLIDVRSSPKSRQPEFNQAALQTLLNQQGVRYVFMGQFLGGKPDDPSCYIDGKVDYDRCESRPQFQHGLDRLIDAALGGHRVALMCSELDPERCHRSKLIGQALQKRSVELRHIDRDGSIISQQDVINRITGGQSTLFEEGFHSVGRYEPKATGRVL